MAKGGPLPRSSDFPGSHVSDGGEVCMGCRTETKYMFGGRGSPERLRHVPIGASGSHCGGPDPVLQAEAGLIAGN